ncbi:MAG: DoxX family membrane protein [Actinomycetes bacterium]
MTLVRRIARPLLATSFVLGGVDQFRHPAVQAEAARPMVAKLAPTVGLPNDPETLVRANGAAMAGAGTLLAIGRLPRLAALVLVASIVPTTYTQHQFWHQSDPTAKRQQLQLFLKNLGLLGGALLAAVDTEGRPGLAWRGKHAAKEAKRAAGHAKKDARRAAKAAKREAKLAAHRAGDAVGV